MSSKHLQNQTIPVTKWSDSSKSIEETDIRDWAVAQLRKGYLSQKLPYFSKGNAVRLCGEFGIDTDGKETKDDLIDKLLQCDGFDPVETATSVGFGVTKWEYINTGYISEKEWNKLRKSRTLVGSISVPGSNGKIWKGIYDLEEFLNWRLAMESDK